MAETGRPKVAETPLELLNNPIIGPGLLNEYWTPVVSGVVGVFAVIVGNYATRRPIWSGIQKHVAAGGGCAAIGYWFDQRKNKKLAERDAIFRHYIELHPDDFPPYARKQFKDVFEPWIPIR